MARDVWYVVGREWFSEVMFQLLWRGGDLMRMTRLGCGDLCDPNNTKGPGKKCMVDDRTLEERSSRQRLPKLMRD